MILRDDKCQFFSMLPNGSGFIDYSEVALPAAIAFTPDPNKATFLDLAAQVDARVAVSWQNTPVEGLVIDFVTSPLAEAPEPTELMAFEDIAWSSKGYPEFAWQFTPALQPAEE